MNKANRASIVKRLAKADFLAESDGADAVEKVKDAWLDHVSGKAMNRDAFLAFIGEHGGDDLNPFAIDELINWPEWRSVEQLA